MRSSLRRQLSIVGARPGATLVELMLFIAILSIVGITVLPLLFASTEDRLLQQTASAVEQNGVQLLQTIGYHVRHAEKLILPEATETGSILHLQTGSGGTDPTIIGLSSGSLVLIRRTQRQTISSLQVAVEQFIVENTSVSGTRQSMLVRFRLSRTIRLQAPRRYVKDFEAVFSLFPDHTLRGGACGCASPGCATPITYSWQVCVSGTCETAQTSLVCP